MLNPLSSGLLAGSTTLSGTGTPNSRVQVTVNGSPVGVTTVDGGRTVVATADARTLDSVATGGFIGLWLGVYATTPDPASATVVEVDRVEYRPA